LGDGSAYKNVGRGNPVPTPVDEALFDDSWDRIVYTTASDKLADDYMELALKLGFATRKIKDLRSDNQVYRVYVTKSYAISFPCLPYKNKITSKDGEYGIFKIPYNGIVWCFEVPNECFVVRRNGHPLLSMNTYSNAAIGIEAMIDRLESWRQELKHWVEQKIFMPIAKMKGFMEKNEWGELEYVLPRLKWNIMHLRDQQQYRQFMLQMHESGVISTKRLLESFDINYDEEIEVLRFERMAGQMAQPGGEQGGELGGLGGMGGGMGGGMPGGMGEMPGGEMGGGMGGEAGGSPPPAGGAGMGAMAGGASPQQSEMVNISQFGGKVLKKDKREKIEKQKEQLFQQHERQELPSTEMRDQKGRIMFTGPEREVMKELLKLRKNGTIKYGIYPQYEVKHGSHPYSIDFALPSLKLGIEVDGYLFHSTDEQKQRDKQRDNNLASQGWTIIRFSDNDVDSKLRAIMDTILQYISKKESQIKASEASRSAE